MGFFSWIRCPVKWSRSASSITLIHGAGEQGNPAHLTLVTDWPNYGVERNICFYMSMLLNCDEIPLTFSPFYTNLYQWSLVKWASACLPPWS